MDQSQKPEVSENSKRSKRSNDTNSSEGNKCSVSGDSPSLQSSDARMTTEINVNTNIEDMTELFKELYTSFESNRYLMKHVYNGCEKTCSNMKLLVGLLEEYKTFIVEDETDLSSAGEEEQSLDCGENEDQVVEDEKIETDEDFDGEREDDVVSDAPEEYDQHGQHHSTLPPQMDTENKVHKNMLVVTNGEIEGEIDNNSGEYKEREKSQSTEIQIENGEHLKMIGITNDELDCEIEGEIDVKAQKEYEKRDQSYASLPQQNHTENEEHEKSLGINNGELNDEKDGDLDNDASEKYDERGQSYSTLPPQLPTEHEEHENAMGINNEESNCETEDEADDAAREGYDQNGQSHSSLPPQMPTEHEEHKKSMGITNEESNCEAEGETDDAARDGYDEHGQSHTSLPSENNSDDSSWTLRFPKNCWRGNDTLVELGSSGIFIHRRGFRQCKKLDSVKSLAQLLLGEIFSDYALRVCTLTPKKASEFKCKKLKPALDQYALNFLLEYVNNCASENGWARLDKHSIMSALYKKLKKEREDYYN